MADPKYSLPENERRFLVESLDAIELDTHRCTRLRDVYIDGTRTRLRSATSADGEVVYKLCKKYPTDDPYSGAMVNIYLTSSEYSVYSALPGTTITKRRYAVPVAGTAFSVNVFEDELAGLVLCVAEQPTRAEVSSLVFPPWATHEVTEDDFFTGGHLSRISARELRQKLASLAGQRQ